MKTVSIIIVSYNTAHFLPHCLDSIKNQTLRDKINTIVIDTGQDETQQIIVSNYPWVDYISYPQNDGFGRANNIGIKKYYNNSDYFLILNPDTELRLDNLEKMVSYIQDNEDVAVLSSKLVLPNGRLDKGCKRSFPTPWKSITRFLFLDRVFPQSKTFGGYNLTYLDEDKIHEVESVKGAYMLVRKKAMEGVGFFDESFFMYGEDLDWCYRFRQKGWKIVYNPDSACIHYQGVSSGIKKHSKRMSRANRGTQERCIRAFHEAMHIFYDKHYKERYPKWMRMIIMMMINLKMEMAFLLLKLKS